MPSSRLDCPLSLKTPNMGNTGSQCRNRDNTNRTALVSGPWAVASSQATGMEEPPTQAGPEAPRA